MIEDSGEHISPITPLRREEMKASIYAVKDVKTNLFTKPMIFNNDETAKRTFSVSVSGGDEGMHAFPNDFVLYRIGSWDDEEGLIEGQDPLRLCGGLEMLKVRRDQQRQLDFLNEEILKLKNDGADLNA